jgi:hypothetical protein
MTALQDLQQKYWQGLKDFLESSKNPVTIENPVPKNWLNISMKKNGFHLALAVNSKTDELYLWLLLDGKDGKDNFDKLHNIAFEESLKVISKDLLWDRMDGLQRSAVKIIMTDADFTKKSDWTKQFMWFKTNLEKFYNYFNPIINNI